MRIWYSGCAVACQATEASSNLAIRSKLWLLDRSVMYWIANPCRSVRFRQWPPNDVYAELVQWLCRSLPSYRDEFDPRIPLQIKSYVGVVEWLIAADCKSVERKFRVGSNPATDSNYLCKFMRIWYSGRAVACQATETSSNLVIRSRLSSHSTL